MTTSGMEVLSPSSIVVGATAADRADAIRRVGAILVSAGLVTEGYVDAMLAREEIISTYLGNGIALPHGTNEAQDTILRTGLAVAQFPEGVPWGDEPARLVIGLAARSEEHIPVMAQLASVLGDAALCERLATTTDANEIHRVLMSEGDESAAAPPPAHVATADASRTLRIANPFGLHARPAAEIVEGLMDFDAEVTIAAGERHANAASITQLIALGATTGDEVTVSGSGDDAASAIEAVVRVLLAEGGAA
jgi:phosphotransferase system HPr (HPr) family protein